MTIQQLKYLLEISKCGSINRAAKNLFISQPCISKAIKELEEDLNIEIFYRQNIKKLQFTPEGTELLCYAKDLVEQAVNIEKTFAQKTKNEYTRLIISSQHYAFVVKAFIEFMKNHDSNNYELLLREKKTSQIVEDVYSHQSNVGIIFLADSTENFMKKYLNSKNIEFYSIKQTGFHAFIRRTHPLAKQETVTMKELSNYPFISYEQDNNTLNFSEEAVAVNASQAISVLDRATLSNIICNTNSYNIGTGFLIEGIVEKDLISIPISDLSGKMNVGWIKRKTDTLTSDEKEFIDLAINACLKR